MVQSKSTCEQYAKNHHDELSTYISVIIITKIHFNHKISCKFVAIQASLALNIVLWSDASSLFHRVI